MILPASHWLRVNVLLNNITFCNFCCLTLLISNFLTPKRHILVGDRVVWAITRKNPPKGLTCRWVSEKKIHVQLEKFLHIFHLFAEKPPCAHWHEILHEGSSCRRNQPCQILFQSDQGFYFCGGSNFWLFHKKEVAVNTGLELPFSLWWDKSTKLTPCSLNGSWASCFSETKPESKTLFFVLDAPIALSWNHAGHGSRELRH